jgi:hypothetical protein
MDPGGPKTCGSGETDGITQYPSRAVTQCLFGESTVLPHIHLLVTRSLYCCQVDAALIGGLVISLGDKFCDMSMATKLKKYSDLLKQAA